MKNEKRILVDMSATLLHHGHIRLLKKAKCYGKVIIALTTDEEIIKRKGYIPELNFSERSEILLSIKYVDEVIPSKWLLDDNFLELHNIDFLVHGDDNSNQISKDKLLIFPRTKDISSSKLRVKASKIIMKTI